MILYSTTWNTILCRLSIGLYPRNTQNYASLNRYFVSPSNFPGVLLKPAVQENAELDGLLKLMLKECEIRTPVHKEKVLCPAS